MENLYQDLGTFSPDSLIAGNSVPKLVNGVILEAGQGVLTRGTVIGIVTATKKAKIVNNAATDGSEKPYAILTDTIDATQEIATTAYITGEFNKNALTFGGDDTAADHELELRKLGIYLKNVL